MTTKQLLRAPVEVSLAGETFQIKEIPWGKHHLVSAKLLPVFMSAKIQEGQPFDLTDILVAGGEAIMDVLAIAINRPRSFMDEITYDEGKALLSAVMETNKELFAKKVLPDLMRLMASGKAPANLG